MRDRTIIVTGCDANHFTLAEDLLASLRALPQTGFEVGFIHVGSAELPGAIARDADMVVRVDDAPFLAHPRAGYALAYLGVKARLPELFPGFDTYIWLDADTWVQDGSALEHYAEASHHAHVAISPECDARYFRLSAPLHRNVSTYYRLYPNAELAQLIRRPMINCGAFAAGAASPLWRAWSGVLAEAREADRRDAFFSDQIPLHFLVCTGQVSMTPLTALDNWQVWAELPTVDLARRKLVSPFWPFEDLRIVHLAGDTKDAVFPLGQTGRSITFRYRDVQALFEGLELDGFRSNRSEP